MSDLPSDEAVRAVYNLHPDGAYVRTAIHAYLTATDEGRGLVAAKQDSARLDIMIANEGHWHITQGRTTSKWSIMDCSNGLTFLVREANTSREAIDAAIAQQEIKP